MINANPTRYTECFYNAATNENALLVLTGSSSTLTELLNTKAEESHMGIMEEEEYNFAQEYLSDKLTEDLENIILKTALYNGTFEDCLVERFDTSKEEFLQQASDLGISYDEFLKKVIMKMTVTDSSWIIIEYYSEKNGWNDKAPSELEQICAELLGFENFDALLTSNGTSRDEFEIMYKEIFEKEEDFLKFMMTEYILGES